MKNAHHVTVVVPVYGDWPSLSDCIDSLKEHVSAEHNVMLVNDCGPDVELMERNIKKAIKGCLNFQYYRNPKNLGFVGTCNRAALELDQTNNDIMLLNSDTKVTAGFLEAMTSVLYATPKVGAVSPRSNNATLATVPLSAAPQKGIEASESYKLYKTLKPKLPEYYDIPVAHGFCMLIRRSLIREYGLFDKAFGKGYGEEVDFCQRIMAHGYTCALSNWAYVFHLEARSFSLETKAKLLEVNNQIIWERYPNYRQAVRDYMERATRQEEALIAGRPPLRQHVKRLVKKSPRLHALAVKAKQRMRSTNR